MKTEVYQVFNPQNKQFVKKDGKTGRILDNSYFKFDGIPLFGPGPDPDQEQPDQPDTENYEFKPTETDQDEPAESTESVPGNDSKEDDNGDNYSGVGMF